MVAIVSWPNETMWHRKEPLCIDETNPIANAKQSETKKKRHLHWIKKLCTVRIIDDLQTEESLELSVKLPFDGVRVFSRRKDEQLFRRRLFFLFVCLFFKCLKN